MELAHHSDHNEPAIARGLFQVYQSLSFSAQYCGTSRESIASLPEKRGKLVKPAGIYISSPPVVLYS